MGGVFYFCLRLHSYSDKFNSDSENFLIPYSNSTPIPNFSKFGKPIVTSKLHFTLASFLVSIDTRLRLHYDSNKLTKIALRIRQKTPYSDSNPIRLRFCPFLSCIRGVRNLIFSTPTSLLRTGPRPLFQDQDSFF